MTQLQTSRPEFDIEIGDWGIAPFEFEVEVKEDDYEIPDEIQTDIQPGDVFLIGPHKLICGDSTGTPTIGKKLMDGQPAGPSRNGSTIQRRLHRRDKGRTQNPKRQQIRWRLLSIFIRLLQRTKPPRQTRWSLVHLARRLRGRQF